LGLPFAADPPPVKLETPTQLAKVSMPSKPGVIAWSPDGAYLAADLVIVDVAKASVTHTLKESGPGGLQGLAFSPDGKWLAVSTCLLLFDVAAAPAELIVYDVPTYTRKFTAKASGTQKGLGFHDLAWSVDSKALYAIEGVQSGEEKNQVRRWTLPLFTEQPAIRTPQSGVFYSLAVSPDGNTLAVADSPGTVRLFNLASGAERTSFKTSIAMTRLGFSPDGRSVGIIDIGKLSWWDQATGKPAKPSPARIAIPPASLGGQTGNRSHCAVSPDGSKSAQASERHPTIIFQKENKNEHGAFIHITDNATGQVIKWRVGETNGTGDTPALAFSADGKKLAGAVRLESGEAVAIWSVPK
jgi:WD40 repeat protein